MAAACIALATSGSTRIATEAASPQPRRTPIGIPIPNPGFQCNNAATASLNWWRACEEAGSPCNWGHGARQAGGADEAAAGLQSVQVAAYGLVVAELQGRSDRVAGAGQFGQEQFAQGDQVRALAIECSQCGGFVPVQGRLGGYQVRRRGGRAPVAGVPTAAVARC